MLRNRLIQLTMLFPIALSSMAMASDNLLLWSEEFDGDGVPDPTAWSYDLGYLGVNKELQVYTNDLDNVKVEDGNLVITARREADGGFTSGRIRTQDKIMFQYGTVEARIRIPDLADGLWPAFWTLGNDISSVGWPWCGEIDIMEMGAGEAIANGEANRRAYSTAHWDIDGNYAAYGLHRTMEADLDDGFHLFRMRWTPQQISTFVDGQHVWTMDISDPDAFSGHEFHAPHFLIINMAVGGWFPGITNPNGITAPLPAEYLVDYIRIYDNGYTILSGSGLEEDCPGDINGDGKVDAADLGLLISAWNTSDPAADYNEDGMVDAADLGLLISAWGNCS